MPKAGTPKTPGLLAYQKRHNERRKEERRLLALQRLTTPRDGAREEAIHKMVDGVVKRLLKRTRNNESRRKRPSTSSAKTNARERAKQYYEEKKKEASASGQGIRSFLEENRKEKVNEYKNPLDRHKERVKTDEAYRIRCNLSTRLGEFLRLKNGTKAEGTMQLVGCTLPELIAHLSSQLKEGETLANMSIDHIFPMTMYDASDPQQQIQMMHWSNLRPMKLHGQGGNISKGCRLPTLLEAQAVQRWAWPNSIDESMLH